MKEKEDIENKQQIEEFCRKVDGDGFIIPFDWAWQVVGYSRKDSAIRALVNNFEQETDYHLHFKVEMVTREQGGGTQPITYFLTADCFKAFCMMAGTEKGREVRLYFIEAEKRLRLIEHGIDPYSGIPERAKYAQIFGGDNIQMIATDYDLTNALWLYAIGAISKAELYRFRFGAERKPTDWELSIDPLRLTWVKHCEAAKHIMSILDAHFPIPGPALSKILCKDSKAKGPWRHNAYHTQYEGQKTFYREACQFLCDRWFERSSQEADEFYRMPPLKQLYAYLRNERNYSESFPELPPIYLWHRLSDNDFDDVRTGYQNGMYDARQIRKLLFNDSVVEKKRNELSDPPAKALIPSIAYEDAIAKIEDAFKYVNQITAKGLARALGLPLNSVEDMKRRTTAWKRQSIRADEAKLIIDIAFNRCYGIK